MFSCWSTKQVSTHLEDRNYTKYLFRSQWYETRNLLQEEKWKKCKYVETKQHDTKTPISQPRKMKEEIRNYPETNEN